MWNIKTLALTVQKLLARLKFQRGGQNDRITELQNDRMTKWQNDRQDKNNMPPDLRSRGHKNVLFSKQGISVIRIIAIVLVSIAIILQVAAVGADKWSEIDANYHSLPIKLTKIFGRKRFSWINLLHIPSTPKHGHR